MGTPSGSAIKVAAVLSVSGAWCAAAAYGADAAPAFVSGDAALRDAWSESAPSFATPTFEDYLAARKHDFLDALPSLFAAGAAPPDRGDSTPLVQTEKGRHFAEVAASGGSRRRAEVGAFYGAEVDFLDAAVSFRDSENKSGDGLYNNGFTRADAEIALSDQAGTTVGFDANYEGNTDRFRETALTPPLGVGDYTARSGEGAAFFRSALWGRAKFSTRVSGTFTDGEYATRPVTDNVLTADSSYDFFWLGDNLARGSFFLSQENYKFDGDQQGYLAARLTLENDFPIADRLYLSGGFGAFSFRRDHPAYRFYPRGRFLWRLSRSWGYFINYRPALSLPLFRDLYFREDYLVPTSFRPVEDNNFSLRTGVSYNFRDVARVYASAYENRFRQTFAPEDEAAGRAVYFDPGRTSVRGAEASYRLSWSRWEQYGTAAYADAKLLAHRAWRFPYFPAYTAAAGIKTAFGAGHEIAAEAKFLGARYPTPEARTPLRAAWIPDARASFRVYPGIDLTAAVENLTDEIYYEAGGIAAPRRSVRAGVNLVF